LQITVAVASSNENQNITLNKPHHNATEVKSIKNTTTDDINDKVSNSTTKDQIIEVPQKDNHNVTEKSAGDTQTALNEQSTIESEYILNDNNDTLLKYIYKKNEKENLPLKTKGHVQNSLKRRKRFINSSDSEIVPKAKILSVPVHYLDSNQGNIKEEQFLPVTQTRGIVQSSNLADFNIETIHNDEAKPANGVNIKGNNYPNAAINAKFYPRLQNDETKEESQESVENNQNNHRLKNDVKIKDFSENRSGSEETSSSFESESVETPNISTSSEYNKDSKETEKYRDSVNPIPRKRKQSDENHESDKSYESSIENSSEASQGYIGKPIELHSDQGNKNKPLIVPKQEAEDYINLEINKSDVEKFPKVSREKYTKDDTVDSLETPKISEEVSNESKSDESKEIYTDSSSVEESKDIKSEKQTLINDEEIKPVVELNNGSIESSEEVSEEDGNSRLKNNSKLVSLTPVKIFDTKNEEISALNDNLDKINIKQQFERIPLDYIHANEVNKNNTSNTTASHIKPTEISSEEKDKEGTLDTLSPINPTYDDELNIKFHDVSIKLPEIKLPEDILSYAYDGPYYETKKGKDKEGQKPKFYYNYEDDDLDENTKEKNIYEEDDFNDYYKEDKEYDNVKQNSKIKNEDDDSEDLYEKFVRERFGKKSIKQRSQKIQDESIPSQLKLRKTLKNILKKTENVKKEAEKSGDPNANYMWTLEYGENL
ncbi:putative uncharacterized protein DDB_G0289963, partial [Papilio machaon]|uniref:putative uncharacterized protein DDB_G0289963 n=1 Tax=Papilio machaon TaxID=76193 RepID=UPI001E662E3D